MKANSGKILVIDHEREICQLLKNRLTLLGYEVILTSNVKQALTIFTNETPDLVILEIFLPNFDGYSLCFQIREISKVPIIILTALNNISDRILTLQLGVDDYITKPFSQKELEARIKSLLRRSYTQYNIPPNKKQKTLQIGNLLIDTHSRILFKKNLKIKLTNIEYNLLEFFIENSGEKLSRETILDKIWGYTPERYVDTRIVDVHISRLRSKIEENPSKPDLILTVRNIGYKFQRY